MRRAVRWRAANLAAPASPRLEGVGVAKVSVRDPPLSGIPGARKSFFTNGLACGALEGIFDAKAGVQSSSYDEKTRTLRLVLKTIR